MVESVPDDVAFCQRCGRRMERRSAFGKTRPVCPGCGFVHFRVTSNAAAAVVVHCRRLLLVERGIEPYKGRWGFPGGFQEYGESLDGTATRETREETGLCVRVERVLHVGHTLDDPRKLVNVTIFLARPAQIDDRHPTADLRAADDAAAVRFFGWDEMPPWSEIAFAHNQQVLRDLRAEFPDGDIR